MKKKFVASVAAVALLFSAIPAHAASVVVKDRPLYLSQPAFIENGRTFVPMRAIFEALGATVDWDGNTRTVTGNLNGKIVTLTNPKIVNGRTMVPLRYISESLGSRVDWVQNMQTAYVDSQVPQVYSCVVYSPQSIQDPSNWTLTLLPQSNNSYLLVGKLEPFDQPFPRTTYSAIQLTKDSYVWRGAYDSRCWVTVNPNGTLGGAGNSNTFNLVKAQYPELANKNIRFTNVPYMGPGRDRVVVFNNKSIRIMEDMNMAPNAGSGAELPLQFDNRPNPLTGIFIPRV